VTEFGLPVEASEWPHGLRCADCHRELGEGDRYSEHARGVAECNGGCAVIVVVVCVPCALQVLNAGVTYALAEQRNPVLGPLNPGVALAGVGDDAAVSRRPKVPSPLALLVLVNLEDARAWGKTAAGYAASWLRHVSSVLRFEG
jgi:hypothetical protein